LNLEWANPGMLAAGLLALFIPLLIHLLTRKTTRDIFFPALRFLAEAMARQSRLFRVRHWLLLLLRTLIVLILLLAFIRPFLLERPRAKPTGSGSSSSIAAVIVLDASASMQYRRGGSSLFGRGKAAAERIIDSLPRDALVNFMLAGATVKSSYPELNNNHHTLRDDLRRAHPTFSRGALRDSVTLAVAQLQKSDAVARELYVLSDYQRSNVADAGFENIPPSITVHHIPIQDAGPENISIVRLEILPLRPGAGSEVEIACSIRLDGTRPMERPIELSVGPEVRIQRTLNLQPGSITTERFRFRINRAGLYEGTVSIPDDDMSFDNTRYFVLRVDEKPLLVFVTDEQDQSGATTRSLRLGIQPFETAAQGRYRMEVVRSGDLLAALYRKPFAVVLSGTRSWREEEAARLSRYFRDGGNVIWFLNHNDDARNYNAMNGIVDGIKLPFLCRDPIQIPEPDEAGRGRWFMANTEHPILVKLRDRYNLNRGQVYRRFVTERQSLVGQVVASYGGGDTALAVVESVGGRMIVANMSTGRQSGNLDRHMFWVPLLQEMLAWCRRQETEDPPVWPGEPVRMVVPTALITSSLSAVTPSGERMTITISPSGGDTAVVNLPESHEAGFYKMYAEGETVGSIAVNVDPRESDLNLLDSGHIRQLTPDENSLIASTAETFDPALMREGRAVWPYLIILLLGLLAVEQTVAHLARKDV